MFCAHNAPTAESASSSGFTLAKRVAASFGGVDMSDVPAMEANIPIPGAMLNRLNPMRDLDKLTGFLERPPVPV